MEVFFGGKLGACWRGCAGVPLPGSVRDPADQRRGVGEFPGNLDSELREIGVQEAEDVPGSLWVGDFLDGSGNFCPDSEFAADSVQGDRAPEH